MWHPSFRVPQLHPQDADIYAEQRVQQQHQLLQKVSQRHQTGSFPRRTPTTPNGLHSTSSQVNHVTTNFQQRQQTPPPPIAPQAGPASEASTNSVIESIGDLSLRPAPAKRVRFEPGGGNQPRESPLPGPSLSQSSRESIGDRLEEDQVMGIEQEPRRPRKLPSKIRSRHPVPTKDDQLPVGIYLTQEFRDFKPEPAVPEAVMNRVLREVKAALPPPPSPSPASSPSSSTALVLYEPNKFLHRVIGVPSRIEEEEEEDYDSDTNNLSDTERMEDEDEPMMM